MRAFRHAVELCGGESHQHFESCRFSFLRFPVLRAGRLRVFLMEGQARRTEYTVTDAACFRVRFTQFTPTVRAFCVSRSWAGIADRIC